MIVKIVELESEYDIEKAYNFALKFPEEEVCRRVIEQYKGAQPTLIDHSQQHSVQVTENTNIIENDARISLFKSKQEYLFYRAAREVFQSFLVFPNVALTAVIEFDSVKDYLSEEERHYFFKALIDCVIIDSENNFMPIRFIELDSPYHREPRQKKKDDWKTKILASAGQKLLRIEQITAQEDEAAVVTAYTKLIRELIK